MRQCDAAEKRKPLFLSWGKLQKASLIFNISLRKGHPYYTPKLQASAQRLKSRCCLAACRLENLSFASPPCLHSDLFASSSAQALGSPLVVLHFVILRFSLRFFGCVLPVRVSHTPKASFLVHLSLAPLLHFSFYL